MISNSTSACFNCFKAWKNGGTCGCDNPDVAYMGKRWRAPRRSQTAIWNKMKRDREAGIKGWSLWDSTTIDSRQQSKRVHEPLTHQEKQEAKARREKAKVITASHRAIFYADLQRILEEQIAKHREIRKKINTRRKRLDRAGAN